MDCQEELIGPLHFVRWRGTLQFCWPVSNACPNNRKRPLQATSRSQSLLYLSSFILHLLYRKDLANTLSEISFVARTMNATSHILALSSITHIYVNNPPLQLSQNHVKRRSSLLTMLESMPTCILREGFRSSRRFNFQWQVYHSARL